MNSQLKMMVIIIDRTKTEKLLSKLNETGVNFVHILRASGTAKSDILDMMGLGDTEKSVFICMLTDSNFPKVKEVLEIDFDIKGYGNGIAFTIPISSVGGPATLQILSGMDMLGGNK